MHWIKSALGGHLELGMILSIKNNWVWGKMMCAVICVCLAWVMQVFVNQGIWSSKKLFVRLQSVKEPVLVLDSQAGWRGLTEVHFVHVSWLLPHFPEDPLGPVLSSLLQTISVITAVINNCHQPLHLSSFSPSVLSLLPLSQSFFFVPHFWLAQLFLYRHLLVLPIPFFSICSFLPLCLSAFQ